MIVTPSSKLLTQFERVDKPLNEIYNMISNSERIENDMIFELSKEIESWRECLIEIELGIISNYDINDKSDNYEEEKEIIIY
jgi:plasmid maintenance system antidote protein VapI